MQDGGRRPSCNLIYVNSDHSTSPRGGSLDSCQMWGF